MASKNSSSIPCYIREMDDKEAQLLALTENLEREDLSPMEEALAMASYLDYTPLSKIDEDENTEISIFVRDRSITKTQRKGNLIAKIEDLATKIPPSEMTIRKRLRLLELSHKVQTMVDNN